MDDDQATDLVARRLLREIRENIEKATSIARAADTCADSGNIDGAVRIVMEFEDPASNAVELFQVLSRLKRVYSVDPV